jgi:hypothetical protein
MQPMFVSGNSKQTALFFREKKSSRATLGLNHLLFANSWTLLFFNSILKGFISMDLHISGTTDEEMKNKS